MSRRTVAALAAMAILVLVPALASAARRTSKRHRLKLTVQQVRVHTTGTAGLPGYTETDAQIDTGTPGGHSAGIATIVYGQGASFTAKTTLFTSSGTIRAKLSGTYQLGPTSYTVSGKGKITGGNGRYKGATGKVSFTGGETVNTTVRTLKVTGTIDY